MSSTTGPSQVRNSGTPPAVRLPWARYHLLMKPMQGGMPIRPRLATVKQPMVTGILRPMPSSSRTSVFSALRMIAPADMNRVSLTRLWQTTCRSAPTKPRGVSVDRPKRM